MLVDEYLDILRGQIDSITNKAFKLLKIVWNQSYHYWRNKNGNKIFKSSRRS